MTQEQEQPRPEEITLDPQMIKPFAIGLDQLTQEGRTSMRQQLDELSAQYPDNSDLQEIRASFNQIETFITDLKRAKEVKIRLDIGQGQFDIPEEKDDIEFKPTPGQTVIEAPIINPFSSALGDKFNNPSMIISGNLQFMQMDGITGTVQVQQTLNNTLGLVKPFMESPNQIIINTDPEGQVSLRAIRVENQS